jgi:glycosyltransferase involved in cell wall biosynthesis
MGFSGQALHSFRRAKQLGYARLELVAGNSHVHNVQALHARAIAKHPLERSWLSGAQIRKTLCEYQMADVIYVASEYTRQTFLAHGLPEQKVIRIHYPVDGRFVPPARRERDGHFRIVYTGSLSVPKGVPVLIEAFARLADPQALLTLVGGSGTRGMKRYLQRAVAADGRIRIAPGDPLPHLQQADVYVHPSYEDNLPYAAAEALACGLTTIVTQDTGVKESVRDGVNGFVVPTGDADALLDRLQAVRQCVMRNS